LLSGVTFQHDTNKGRLQKLRSLPFDLYDKDKLTKSKESRGIGGIVSGLDLFLMHKNSDGNRKSGCRRYF
jgi:hypothetical protein